MIVVGFYRFASTTLPGLLVKGGHGAYIKPSGFYILAIMPQLARGNNMDIISSLTIEEQEQLKGTDEHTAIHALLEVLKRFYPNTGFIMIAAIDLYKDPSMEVPVNTVTITDIPDPDRTGILNMVADHGYDVVPTGGPIQ